MAKYIPKLEYISENSIIYLKPLLRYKIIYIFYSTYIIKHNIYLKNLP